MQRNMKALCVALMLATGTVGAAAEGTRSGIWAPYVQGELVPEIVAELPGAVGNIAFTPDGEIIYSHHPFYGNPVKVAKLAPDGKSFTPYPNAEWNRSKPSGEDYLDTVLGIRGDAEGIIWMSDMMHGDRKTPKLVGWNSKTDSLEALIQIPEPATLPCNADECASQLNDFVIDDKHEKFYLADENIGPAGTLRRRRS